MARIGDSAICRALHQPRAQTRVAQTRTRRFANRQPRPQARRRVCRDACVLVSPTRITLAPVCSVSSRRLPGAIAYRPSQSSPTVRTRTCEARCDTRCRGAPDSPNTRLRCAAHRPTRPRRAGAAGTRPRPARNPPIPVAGRRTDQPHAGARPSACSTCRCSSVSTIADRARHVHRRRPAPARPPPPRAPRPAGSETWPAACRSDNARQQLARATGPARRENRTLHRRGRRPERGCRRPPRSRPARRAGGRGCLVEYVRPDSESPCRPP